MWARMTVIPTQKESLVTPPPTAPRRTGELFVRLLPIDPRHVWAFWEVPDFEPGLRLQIRDAMGVVRLDIALESGLGDWFFETGEPDLVLLPRIVRLGEGALEVISAGDTLHVPGETPGPSAAVFTDGSARFAHNPFVGRGGPPASAGAPSSRPATRGPL